MVDCLSVEDKPTAAALYPTTNPNSNHDWSLSIRRHHVQYCNTLSTVLIVILLFGYLYCVVVDWLIGSQPLTGSHPHDSGLSPHVHPLLGDGHWVFLGISAFRYQTAPTPESTNACCFFKFLISPCQPRTPSFLPSLPSFLPSAHIWNTNSNTHIPNNSPRRALLCTPTHLHTDGRQLDGTTPIPPVPSINTHSSTLLEFSFIANKSA